VTGHGALLLVSVALLAGCTVGPTPIDYGTDECVACRMRITDARFGSELVSTSGKPYRFDAVECLVGFLEQPGQAGDDIHSLWVSNFATPGELIDARTAFYLRTDGVRSPMGLNVLAFATAADRDAAQTQYGGDGVTWADLPELRRQARAAQSQTAPAGMGRRAQPNRGTGSVRPE